ncbi:hypothetical protein QSI_0302 [Clostridioides difficile P28]|nr:hypothetical protein QSI_0302 [Clostridioides difficile P28]
MLFFSLSRIMFCIVIAEAGETDSYQQFKSKARMQRVTWR